MFANVHIFICMQLFLSLYSLLQDDTRNTTRKRNTCIVIKRIEIQQQQARSSSLVIKQPFLLAHRQLRMISRQSHIFMCPRICSLDSNVLFGVCALLRKSSRARRIDAAECFGRTVCAAGL